MFSYEAPNFLVPKENMLRKCVVENAVEKLMVEKCLRREVHVNVLIAREDNV